MGEKINSKTDKTLSRLTKKKKSQITKITNQTEDITADLRVIFLKHYKEYNNQMYANKLDNLDGMNS